MSIEIKTGCLTVSVFLQGLGQAEGGGKEKVEFPSYLFPYLYVINNLKIIVKKGQR